MRDATQATIEHNDSIEASLEAIRAELASRIAEIQSPTWADVGELAKVSSDLRDVVAFMRNEER
ncbi:hypothetical protein HN371_01085 [Candidatus Poribacteria bacterium]|jgi:hypothetical protein|nr:hypothetical protein [Candidatus Poribacteria bacterium]